MIRRFTLPLLLAWVPVSSFNVEAAETKRCAALATSAERIVCYDAQFPPDATPTPATPAPAPEHAAQVPSRVSPLHTAPVESQAPVASPRKDARRPFMQALFDKPERVHEKSAIKAIHRRDSQNMIFLLANDQIWLQDSQRSLPFRVGDAVTIKNGTFGGYFLTSDRGTKTRVRRIK